ncbi:MAG: cyclic pyranopterin monophosphate synthase MoaC [Candidatus Methylarchaceae archaeon HK02M1]|nr:cyclic pyranopterin monophosphate synthase MoaC [Candidatus Methylarchaceae archaeon HK02M1]
MGIKMVDISKKPEQYREAVASGEIRLKPETIKLIREGKTEKGDSLQIATLAGINGTKFTSWVIPLCHPIPVESTEVDIQIKDESIVVTMKVIANSKTGVEMEALVATSIALLNIWDVVKKYEKDEEGQYPTTMISNIKVLRKVKEDVGSLRRA